MPDPARRAGLIRCAQGAVDGGAKPGGCALGIFRGCNRGEDGHPVCTGGQGRADPIMCNSADGDHGNRYRVAGSSQNIEPDN